MSVKLFDTHCHLQDDDFAEDREEVYERAAREGVGLIVPGYTMGSSADAVTFTENHEGAWALVGIHPHEAKDRTSEDLEQLAQWVTSRPKVLGIGEVGLDYHYNFSEAIAQRAVFQEQLELAKRLDVPVSVHTREAEDDTWSIIQAIGNRRGVIHCFTGTASFAERLLEFGWYISFSGVITFKSAHELRQVAAAVPMDRLLIETDSPYLSPVPWRGQRNEPLRVIRVAEIIAAQKNCSTKEVLEATLSNTITLFFAQKTLG